MTVVAMCSVGGAPGVTTLACLVGAVWPLDSPVLVAECDPSGGALAARFALQGRVGMTSFALANRHTDGAHPPVDAHLQRLPGGLEVLAGAIGAEAARLVDGEVAGIAALLDLRRPVVADLGRILPGCPGQQLLLARADRVVMVVSDDPAAVATLAAATPRLRDLAGDRLALAVVTARRAAAREVAGVVDVPLVASVPHDPSTAAIVRGEPGRARRLARSALVGAAVTMQTAVGVAPVLPSPVAAAPPHRTDWRPCSPATAGDPWAAAVDGVADGIAGGGDRGRRS